MNLSSGRLAKLLAGTIAATAFALPAYAGSIAGQIGSYHVFPTSGAMDYQYTLSGSPVICNSKTFAYLNQTDTNYMAIWRALMSAREHGTSVQIFWAQDASGFCHITEVAF